MQIIMRISNKTKVDERALVLPRADRVPAAVQAVAASPQGLEFQM